MNARAAVMLGAFWALACSSSLAPEQADADTARFTCLAPTELSFTPDAGDGDEDEAYVCFGFDAAGPGLAALGGVVWRQTDAASPTLLHHATLYAVPSDFPDGPVPCDGMPPGAVGLHVFTPGGDDLELPVDVALAVPADTQRFVIEAHVRRAESGPAQSASATLCAPAASASQRAAFLGYASPVPALRPMHDEESDGTCQLPQAAHLWSVWPHMHLAGRAIAVQLREPDGAQRTLVDVNPWNFHHQRTYPISVDAHAGDTLQTHCSWHNGTAAYIFGGLRSEDEMCNTGLIVWPAEAASCL